VKEFSALLYESESYLPAGITQVRMATKNAIISRMVWAVGNFSFFNGLYFNKNKDSIILVC
jgi:precorrin isomerase